MSPNAVTASNRTHSGRVALDDFDEMNPEPAWPLIPSFPGLAPRPAASLLRDPLLPNPATVRWFRLLITLVEEFDQVEAAAIRIAFSGLVAIASASAGTDLGPIDTSASEATSPTVRLKNGLTLSDSPSHSTVANNLLDIRPLQ